MKETTLKNEFWSVTSEKEGRKISSERRGREDATRFVVRNWELINESFCLKAKLCGAPC